MRLVRRTRPAVRPGEASGVRVAALGAPAQQGGAEGEKAVCAEPGRAARSSSRPVTTVTSLTDRGHAGALDHGKRALPFIAWTSNEGFRLIILPASSPGSSQRRKLLALLPIQPDQVTGGPGHQKVNDDSLVQGAASLVLGLATLLTLIALRQTHERGRLAEGPRAEEEPSGNRMFRQWLPALGGGALAAILLWYWRGDPGSASSLIVGGVFLLLLLITLLASRHRR